MVSIRRQTLRYQPKSTNIFHFATSVTVSCNDGWCDVGQEIQTDDMTELEGLPTYSMHVHMFRCPTVLVLLNLQRILIESSNRLQVHNKVCVYSSVLDHSLPYSRKSIIE